MPLGLWLSSGLDSSTLLHYAAAASSTRLKTLSISFAGRSFDEAAPVRELTAQYGTDHQEFDVNQESGLTDAIEQFAYYFDEPNADGGALPVWFLSRMTRQTGDGRAQRRGRGRAVRRLPDVSRGHDGAVRAHAAEMGAALGCVRGVVLAGFR